MLYLALQLLDCPIDMLLAILIDNIESGVVQTTRDQRRNTDTYSGLDHPIPTHSLPKLSSALVLCFDSVLCSVNLDETAVDHGTPEFFQLGQCPMLALIGSRAIPFLPLLSVLRHRKKLCREEHLCRFQGVHHDRPECQC